MLNKFQKLFDKACKKEDFSMRRGYIKLYRKMTEWEWAKDAKTFRLFIHLLLTVNNNPVGWRGVKIKQGETVTSLASLSSDTGLSVREVRTALAHLQKTGEITVKTTKFYTLIKVVNYGFYQGFEHFSQHSGDKHKTDRRTQKSEDSQQTIKKE